MQYKLGYFIHELYFFFLLLYFIQLFVLLCILFNYGHRLAAAHFFLGSPHILSFFRFFLICSFRTLSFQARVVMLQARKALPSSLSARILRFLFVLDSLFAIWRNTKRFLKNQLEDFAMCQPAKQQCQTDQLELSTPRSSLWVSL